MANRVFSFHKAMNHSNLASFPTGLTHASSDRVTQLQQETELAYARLEQERAARVQTERDLAGVKAMLRESTQQLARQQRTLTWQFGEAVTRARTLADYVLLPYRLIKLSGNHRRQRRHMPAARKPAALALPAETASAIKETLDYAKRVRSPEVILWLAKKPWPVDVRTKVLCEVAKWARTSYPHVAEQIVEQLLTLDCAAVPVRQLAFSLYDAGLVGAPARLLQAARTAGATLTASERVRARHILNADDILRQQARAVARGGYSFDFGGRGPIVILTTRSILQCRGALDNALHRHAASLRAKYGDVLVLNLVLNLVPDEHETPEAGPASQPDLVFDGVAYKTARCAAPFSRPAHEWVETIAQAALAATVRQPPRAILAWNDAHCALGASAAARTLRVPAGLVLHSLRFFQKTAANHLLSERAQVDLKLLVQAVSQVDLLGVGSLALDAALTRLAAGQLDSVVVPPLPLPPAHGRKEGADDIRATLLALEGKRVLTLSDEQPDPAAARNVIELYAEISLRRADTVLLVLSSEQAAAAMRHHAVAIGLHEAQVVFAPQVSDAASREQLLRRTDIALFPYMETRADHAIVPSVAGLLECMALGICVAVGPSPAYTGLVEPDRAGLHFDLAAPTPETAAAMLALLDSLQAAATLGKRGREQLLQRMPWQEYDAALDALLMQAAPVQPAASRRAESRLLHMKAS